MRSQGKAFTITHSEYFDVVSADTADVITNFLINPGNTLLFPWLATVAPAWEKYRFQYLAIEYVPSCSTATSGDLAMFVDFDPEDPVAADFTEFAQNYNCAHTNMYVPVTLNIATVDMDRQNRGFYYTTDVAVGADDYEHYYPGRLEVFTSTLAAAMDIGKLWVHYKIDLYNPQGHAVSAPGYFKSTAAADIPIGDEIFIESDNVYIYSKAFSWTSKGLTCTRSGNYFITLRDFQSSTLTLSGVSQAALVSTSPDKWLQIWEIVAIRGDVLSCKSDEIFAAANCIYFWMGESAILPTLTVSAKKKKPKPTLAKEPVKRVAILESDDDDESNMMDEKPVVVRKHKSPLRK